MDPNFEVVGERRDPEEDRLRGGPNDPDATAELGIAVLTKRDPVRPGAWA